LFIIEDILKSAETAAEKIQNFDGKIRLIGQYDADGICATAIAHEMLERLDKDFEYEILKQLYEEDVKRLAEEDEDLLLFVDIGSGQSELLEKYIIKETDKKIVVSDHHEPQIEGSFTHINPHFLGLDGGEAISAAGMTYLLAEKVSEENEDLIPFALTGAAGDVQKQEGEFLGVNEQLAEKAVGNGYLEKKKGLDLYGRSTKPIQDSLKYTTDPHLEGISNNESGAIQLVESAGIDTRKNGDFRTLADLSEEEERRLTHRMIEQGLPVQQLLNNIYILENGYEIDEFSTVINACGRLGEPKKGVKILLKNDEDLIDKMSSKYGRKVSKSLRYVENNKEDNEIVYEKNIGVIDGNSSIDEEFIGTVTTIAMSNGMFNSSVVMGVADAENDKVKISSRATKEAVESGLNLGEVIGEICEECDGEGGGHNIAAGAKIPQREKQKFIESLNNKIAETV